MFEYFENNSFKLKDLALKAPKSLSLKDHQGRGLQHHDHTRSAEHIFFL